MNHLYLCLSIIHYIYSLQQDKKLNQAQLSVNGPSIFHNYHVCISRYYKYIDITSIDSV